MENGQKISQKKQFYIFIFINAFLWSLIQFLRNVISIDAMEAICWGELFDFGTNKHPPFSGWLMGGFYNLFNCHDWIAYFLGQACILIGFVFLYKLAKFFMNKEKAICASIIISSCYYYTYIAIIDNFNCNFVSMALIPMSAYFFYKAIKKERTLDWAIFGIISGIAFLTKYQVAFFDIALFIYLIVANRTQFKKKGMYIALICGLITILPHIIFLFKTDFFSFIYMTDRTHLDPHNIPKFLIPYGRIIYPIKFVIDQLLACTTVFVVYLFLALQAKNISILKDNFKEKFFIFSICFVPMILQGSTAILSNSRVQGIWGSIMVCFMGIFLFYFFPIKFNQKTFSHFMKWIYSLMIFWLIGMFVFLQLQTKRTLSYPYQKIMPEMNKIWAENTNNAPLKYVGGNIDWIFQFHLYNKEHPKVILETFRHKNPWINEHDIIKSGSIILGHFPDEVIKYSKELIELLPEDYKIEPISYDFEIKNALGKVKKYRFYYAIIPPKIID